MLRTLIRPMALASLFVLDVGHGNAALIQDDQWAVVIDCAPGSVLLETLTERGIQEIDALVISHADSDHVGGALAMLADEGLRVARIFVNGDWFKGTKTWDLLRRGIRDARSRNGLVVTPHLSTDLGAAITHGSLTIEVAAPSPELLLGSADRRDLSGRGLSSNSLSAVLRILDDGKPVALFTGDLDHVGLANLQEAGVDVSAEVLIFPHHGGLPGAGGDPAGFAGSLCDLVQPSLVVFSIGREGHSNPRPEIAAVVRARLGGGRIACTQLSRHCAATISSESLFGHLSGIPSAGGPGRVCCAGSLALNSATGMTDLMPTRDSHIAFIQKSVPTPMCFEGAGGPPEGQQGTAAEPARATSA